VVQEEAARIVEAASVAGRVLTGDEDAYVLGFPGQVRALNEEIHRVTRHHAEPRGGERE
jgi:hypothetical protein